MRHHLPTPLTRLRRGSQPAPPRPALQADDFPRLARAGDASASASQQMFTRWIKATLLLVVLAAVMGAVEERWAGWVAASAFAGALVLGVAALRREIEARWYDARALTETVKSMTWKYAVGSGEFPTFGEEPRTTRRRFDERLVSLLAVVSRIKATAPDGPGDLTEVEALRDAPLATRMAAFREGRVMEQQRWYADAAGFHQAWARLWQLAAGALQCVGIAGAVLKGLGETSVDWLGIAAAAAAAATAWVQTKDHVSLGRAYTVTAHELSIAAGSAPSEEATANRETLERRWCTYVDDTEAAISREHNLWLGRRRGTERDAPFELRPASADAGVGRHG